MSDIKDAKRIVIKVGSSTLTHEGGYLDIRTFELLTKIISDLKNLGKEIILVSSGAISVGMSKLHLSEKPELLSAKQALAAIGQCELMHFYENFFAVYNHMVAQILLTKDVVDDHTRYNNAKNTFETLLEYGVIPIVNENDTISTEQIEFGDNDTLSAHVCKVTNAELLIILSDIDGLYDKNPNLYPDAKIIDEVSDITDEIRQNAGGAGTSRGTGGMITKLAAAQIATNCGANVLITNGKNPNLLYDIFDGKKVGTVFRRK